MKTITKYFLNNPSHGSPINSNGVVLAVGENMEIPEATGKELIKRYQFLSLTSQEVKVKIKRVKKFVLA